MNYWFSDSLVVKLSYHDTDGNMFAVPADHEELNHLTEHNLLDESNRLINLGVQFSF